ncbi:MAG TPA: carbohydrate binding domain-containing protein, partial [Polyangiaceae bacterium]|nr:carbohydrate binding domain-containing protein [Polyangiaceae bacterium]
AAGCFGYFLTADLNFDTNSPAGVGPEDQFFTPMMGWDTIPEFFAEFDGGGHVIRNLTIIAPPNDGGQGLFGRVVAGNIRNLRFENAQFTNFAFYTGVLAGEVFESSVRNVSVGSGSMFVNNSQFVGGLIGYCGWTDLSESFTGLDVRAGEDVGGLVGQGENCNIARSFVTGRVTSARYHAWIGGLAGEMIGGSIRDSFMSGVVGEGHYFGGLIGLVSGGTTITNTFVSGAVVGSGYAGGGVVGFGQAAITSSFFATDTTGYTKARTGGTSTAVAVTLADLKCTDTANDPDCKSGLFSGWQSVLNWNGQPAWDFGTNQQVPALRLNGVVYRDSDGDGVLDANDKFPSAWEAAADNDNDGAPDYWREGCNEQCQGASTLVLDQFPHKVAAAKDLDLDGRPDAWNASCNAACQSSSGLTLDTRPNDYDNDGLIDTVDQDDDGNGVADVDLDSDGLIDIHNITELAKVNLDGTGISLRNDSLPDFGSIANNSGCLPRVVPALVTLVTGQFILSHDGVTLRGAVLARHCRGYELLNDLDFGSAPADWDSLGHLGDATTEAFQSTFEGNGHTIANFMTTDHESGLFGGLRGATIRNLGVVGSGTNIQASNLGGGLAADAIGSTITNCYSAVSPTGVGPSGGYASDLAGLVGRVAGTVIKGCFATGNVVGADANCGPANCDAFAGLVGEASFDSSVSASFATGSVNSDGGATGGLVGFVTSGSTVSGSFSTGPVSGVAGTYGGVGGLIGRTDTTAVVASHWATDRSGRSTSAGGGQGATQAQLQCPVGSTNTTCLLGTTLFDHWEAYVDSLNRPYWNQGTSTELPGLCLSGKLYRPTTTGTLAPVTSCNCSQLTQQLVTNQTFETNTSGWVGSSGTTISSSTLQAHGGTRSLRVVNRTQGTWQGAEYPLLGTATPGETLAASVWARIANDPSEPVQLTLRSTCQGASTVYTAVASGTATNTGWLQLSGNVTIPNCTLTEATVYVEGPRTTVELFVDDASITRTRTVCPGQQASISGIFNTTQSGSNWYCGALTISNPFSIATADWSSVVNLNGTTMYDYWNIYRTSTTGNTTVTPAPAWAKVIPAGGNNTGSIGFCAYRTAGSNAAPSSVVVTATF